MTIPYPLLIQKENNAGDKTTVTDTYEDFGIVSASGFPFRVYGDPKELPENDWNDVDGIETFAPDTGLPIQAYEAEVTFYCKGTYAPSVYGGTATRVKAFLDYLCGKDNKGTYLSIYDKYTGIGRQNILVSSVSPDVYYRETSSKTITDVITGTTSNMRDEFVSFQITFKVNDPTTDITLALA